MKTMIQTIRNIHKREDGASLLIFFLLMFSIVFIIFGLGFDISVLRSAQAEAQATLDSATVAATTQLQTNKNKVDADGAAEVAEEFYSKNRKAIFQVKCMSAKEVTAARKAGAAKATLVADEDDTCMWVKTREVVKNNSYRMSAYECVETVFLKPIMPEYCFFVDSTARTSQLAN